MSGEEVRGAAEPEEATTRRLSVALTGGAVVLAFLLACPCAIAALFAARHFVATSEVAYLAWSESAERVAWSGDGRYGVLQDAGADGTPLVVVWDRTTGEVRTAEGFRLAAVERYGAAAWLVPIERADLAAYADDEWWTVLVPADAPRDAPPEALELWDLEKPAPRGVASGVAEWTRWPGPGEWSVTAVVDPEVGSYPHALRIAPTDSFAEDIPVELPSDLATFDPVGWSASGRHFALAELLHGVEPAGAAPRRLLVVDVARKTVVSVVEQGAALGYGTAPVWHPTQDVLLWADAVDPAPDDERSPRANGLLALEPGGAVGDALEVLGVDGAPAWTASDRIRVCGTGRKGVLIEVAGTDGSASLWWIGVTGIGRASGVPDLRVAPVYHQTGGVLMLSREFDESSGRSRAALVHGLGAEDAGEVVWTGEWQAEKE